jgi:hypothetical protein
MPEVRENAMVRNVSRQSAALATARARRRELDRERDSQDLRVEQATAEALVMLQLRGEAQTALEVASAELGTALRTLLEQDVSAERAAALLELDLTEVRRLTKPVVPDNDTVAPAPTTAHGSRPGAAGGGAAGSAAKVAALPSAEAGNDDGARRAG